MRRATARAGAVMVGVGLAAAGLAGCGFGGTGTNGSADARPRIDADPDRPDADPDDPDAKPGDPDAPPAAVCPASYVAIDGLATASRYRFVGAPQASWVDAETDCEDDAGPTELATHLVVLDDAVERDAVIGGVNGGGELNDQWIGLTDLAAEGTFLYVTNQPSVLVGTPTGNQNDEDCVRLKNTTGHEIRDCDETNRYVCECDGRDARTANFPNPPDGN